MIILNETMSQNIINLGTKMDTKQHELIYHMVAYDNLNN